jgi:hypothetical protein
LFHRLNREEATRYLEDRARKGFTVIQAVALAELDGLTVPNAYGALPLVARDPARPDEAYFAHVDFIVEKAESLGLFVGFLPTWGKYWKAGDPAKVFTPDNARSYGRFLGARYRDRAIIWILGGDQNVENAEERAIIDAMAAGLREGDGGTHLITFHPRGPGQSSLKLHDAPWLDFHMTQSSHGARDHDTGLYAERDLSLTPVRPTLDGEPRYETIPVGFYLRDHDRLDRFDDDDVRQAAWWSVMAGACGHTHGDNNIWQMWQPGRTPVINASIPWHEALDHPGARQMGLLRRFMEPRFHLLVPDQQLVANGPGERPCEDPRGARERRLVRDRVFAARRGLHRRQGGREGGTPARGVVRPALRRVVRVPPHRQPGLPDLHAAELGPRARLGAAARARGVRAKPEARSPKPEVTAERPKSRRRKPEARRELSVYRRAGRHSTPPYP